MDVTATRHIAETQVKDQPREDDERDRRSMEGGDQEKSKGREAEGGDTSISSGGRTDRQTVSQVRN